MLPIILFGIVRYAAAALPSVSVEHEPFVQLEHVNLNSGGAWSESCEEFWFEVLRCGRDRRAQGVLELTNSARAQLDVTPLGGLTWANVGLQQFHLPFADSLEESEDGRPWQRVRGEIVLSWPEDKIQGLRERVNRSTTTEMVGNDVFTGLGNNTFRLVPGKEKIGPFSDLANTHLPGNPSEGLGMKSIRFHVPKGSTPGICAFYKDIFEADTVEFDESCSVLVGFEQSIEFVEKDDVELYDRHHVALYLNGPAFSSSYHKLRERDLIYFNPRFPQFHYDTYEDALHFNEYRFKDIVASSSSPGKTVIYEIEHEIRTLNHQGFQPYLDSHHKTCTD